MEAEKKKRRILRSLLTKKINESDTLTNTKGFEPSVLIAQIEHLNAQVKASNEKIQAHLFEEEDPNEDILTDELNGEQEYEDRVIATIIQLRHMSIPDVRKCETPVKSTDCVKLPTLHLPFFDGNILEYQPFMDSFGAAIGSREISDVEKFNYLRNQLKGNALKSVQGLALTTANYKEALEILEKRYGRPSTIIRAHVKELLSLEKVSKMVPATLRKLVDQIEINVRGLRTLGVTSDSYAIFLNQIVLSKLPTSICLEWARKCDSDEEGIQDLLEFLDKEIQSHEILNESCDDRTSNSSKAQTRYESAHVLQVVQRLCLFCHQSDHFISNCAKFMAMPPNERNGEVKRLKLCFNCLRKHQVKDCTSVSRCKRCHRKHHTCLHREEATPKAEEFQKTAVTTINVDRGAVMLQTAVCFVNGSGSRGKRERQRVRVLLDGGSELSYVRRDLLRSISYENVCERELNLIGFGEKSEGQRRYDEISITLFDTHSDKHTKISTIVVDRLCSPVNARVSVNEICRFAEIQGLQLADSLDNLHEPIDILIGANQMYEVLLDNRIRTEFGPTAELSIFGWILHGPVHSTSRNPDTCINLCVCEDMLKSFWQRESLGIAEGETFPDQNELAMKNFKESITQTETGRYQVGWPWIDKQTLEMDDARDVAMTRLESLSKRLQRNKALLNEYQRVINEYLENGIAERIGTEESQPTNQVRYLPHHCVVKEAKTTKVRIVFDATSKDKNGISLNDLMMKGPNLNPKLLGILIRFRLRPIAVTADIKQAFLQIGLNEEEQDLVRFLWYNEAISQDWPTQAPQAFRMKRVVFGVKSSPFLLAATIRHHLEKRTFEEPIFKEILANNLYVDDLVVSLETVHEARKIFMEASRACQEMEMELRKWTTNDPFLATELNFKRDSSETSVLGLQWNPIEDKIRSNIPDVEDETPTKRNILRTVSQIFDPLGIMSPVTVIIKHLLQQIWRLKVEWDDRLPMEIVAIWNKWIQEWNHMKEMWIDRYVHFTSNHNVELHAFADASQKACAAVIYIKSIEHNGEGHINFMIARTKVAPLKGETIPRLELMACLLAAKLIRTIISNFETQPEYFCWTDSKVALSWIRSEPHLWKPYVRNRASEIQLLTDKTRWKHVKGEENPADIPSRGMLPSKLKDCDLWWKGPNFILNNSTTLENVLEDELEIPESSAKELKKQTLSHNVVNIEPVIPLRAFSNFGKLIRVTCLVRRFIHNCRSSVTNRLHGPLNEKEIEQSKDFWIKHAQQGDFHDEIDCLKNGHQIPKSSRLSCLNPVLDSSGNLRSGGRLGHSKLETSAKFPIILPNDSWFTELVIRNRHEELVHAGVTTVLASLRSEYWILHARRETKKIIRKCPPCVRQKSKPFSEDTAPLPIERVDTDKPFPFLYIGVDFAGPLFVNNGGQQIKTYILLITCTRIRAVHLELTLNLSTAEFLDAFDRFIARRGVPSIIFSDNAKTFKRAADVLSSNRGIRWRFITERAPWHGGFWERLVQSVKIALRKSLGRSVIELNKLGTLLCQIEGAVNDRPISYLENGPGEPDPLTPAKFLIGRNASDKPSTERVHGSYGEREFNDRWHERNQMLEHFWERWRMEYLPLLNGTYQKANPVRKIKIGDVVLIHVDDKGKHLWPLGRVTALHPSSDGKIRTASLQSKGSVLRRPVQKLYFLESTEKAQTVLDDVNNSASPSGLNGNQPSHDEGETANGTENSAFTSRTSTRNIHPPQKYGW